MPVGYTLSSEEFGPRDLVRFAVLAEEVGFEFAMVSDHYHPWTDRQGHSPFVWSVLGGVAQATSSIRVGTGVTCPTIRIHPAIVAQAAATVADAMPGRFFLGLGTGENLNEHILGHRWPRAGVRRRMLSEAIDVIRMLWRGGMQNHHGEFFTVENARVYTLPEEAPPILVAAAGERSLELAAEKGDGLIAVGGGDEVVDRFREEGGSGPCFVQLHVCWAETEAEARATALEEWPNAAIPGELGQELPLPRHFEQATQRVDEDDIAGSILCSPDPERHVGMIREVLDAGFDHVYVHQVGPRQEEALRFYADEVLPKVR